MLYIITRPQIRIQNYSIHKTTLYFYFLIIVKCQKYRFGIVFVKTS